MNTTYGRAVFGISSVLFGVLTLMWHDFDTWQSLFRILRWPGGTVVGDVLMIALIAGGVLVAIPRGVHLGSRILAVLFALFTIVCIFGIFKAPKIFGEYDGVFEQVAMLSAAIAIVATTLVDTARSARLLTFARIGYGLSLISFMLAQIIYFGLTAPLVPKWLPPNQTFWAWATTVAFGLAAVAVLLNIRARLALGLTAVMLAVFGLVVWVPALIAHPESHNDWSEFAFNALIMAAAWVTADSVGRSAKRLTI
ncbi:MAG TPA: hypothetical protein VGK84_13770 [Candidatus Tumulicola sp.]|jgi:MFS family permease